MIIGSFSLDPRRVISANYFMISKNLYDFKIGYVIGNSVTELDQYGSKSQCIDWLSIADTVIGKDKLIEAISSKSLDADESDSPESKIGF